jgi:hypothetical protein
MENILESSCYSNDDSANQEWDYGQKKNMLCNCVIFFLYKYIYICIIIHLMHHVHHRER